MAARREKVFELPSVVVVNGGHFLFYRGDLVRVTSSILVEGRFMKGGDVGVKVIKMLSAGVQV